MTSINTYRPYIILVLFLIILGVLSLVFSTQQTRLRWTEPSFLNEGWVWHASGDTIDLERLPVKVDAEASSWVIVSNTLSEDFHQPQVLLVRTSLQNVMVYVDDVMIYEKTYQQDQPLPPYASMWHFIEIPVHSDAKIIEIHLSSPYEAMSGTLNYIAYGSRSDLYGYIAQSYGYRFLIGAFVLLSGFLMMILSFFIKKGEASRYTYLGLFAVTLSFWILAESRMIQFLTGNEFIIGTLAYLSLAIFPIPMLYYLKNYIVSSFKHLYHVMIGIFYVQSILITVFHATGISDYFETVIYTQIFLVLGILVVIATLVAEMTKHQNKEARKIIKYLAFVLFFVLIELINFLMGDFEDTSIYALTGVGLLMFLILLNYAKYLIGRFKMSYEKELFERMAYMDWLTGGKNRLKYELDFDIYFKDSELKKRLRLIGFDLDYLKQVNDEYGHLEGDKILKKGFELIEKNFGPFGACYRIGGDEFACLVLDMDDVSYRTLKHAFRADIQEFDQTVPYDFRISMGSSVFMETVDVIPDTMIKRADADMYLDKCTFKGNCKR